MVYKIASGTFNTDWIMNRLDNDDTEEGNDGVTLFHILNVECP